jgi:hypothetical protein
MHVDFSNSFTRRRCAESPSREFAEAQNIGEKNAHGGNGTAHATVQELLFIRIQAPVLPHKIPSSACTHFAMEQY